MNQTLFLNKQTNTYIDIYIFIYIKYFDQNFFVEYLEDVTNKDNCKVILSNSHDFEGVIAENHQINLPNIITVSVKDLTNTTKPAKDRVEIIGTNL